MADIRLGEPDGELRMRVAASGAALAVAVGICYHEQARIYHLLTSALPEGHRQLVTFAPGEAASNALMIAVLGGLVLSLPAVSHELCAYTRPGLRPELLIVPGLCVAGVIFGWAVVVPVTLHSFGGYDSNVVSYLPRAGGYIRRVMLTVLATEVAVTLAAARAMRGSS
jgi:Sec-independent protein secretion pathway component TatC